MERVLILSTLEKYLIRGKPPVPSENPLVLRGNPLVSCENPLVPRGNPLVPRENPLVPRGKTSSSHHYQTRDQSIFPHSKTKTNWCASHLVRESRGTRVSNKRPISQEHAQFQANPLTAPNHSKLFIISITLLK